MSPGVDRSKVNDCEKSEAKRISTTSAGELLFARFGSDDSEFCNGTLSSFELETHVQPSPQLDFAITDLGCVSQVFFGSAGEQHERIEVAFWQHLQFFLQDEQLCDGMEFADLLEQHFSAQDEALH